MMPIFFNFESHLWIVYLFVVNGLIFSNIFTVISPAFGRITQPIESKIIIGFGFTLLVNATTMWLMTIANIDWKHAIYPLSFITISGTIFLYRKRGLFVFFGEISLARALLYLVVALVMFINGALIESLSDAWWHMSLANKIGIANKFILEESHLNGASPQWYPPLWHVNLALARELSGQSLAVFWNSATVWLAVFKVASVYLFATALSSRKAFGVLSAILFVLIPGIGVSYLRVSAWPSHIAYTFMFLCLYLQFKLVAEFEAEQVSRLSDSLKLLMTKLRAYSLMLIFGVIIVLFTHQLELLWLALSMLFFMIALHVYNDLAVGGRPQKLVEQRAFGGVFKICVILLTVLSGWYGAYQLEFFAVNPDKVLASGLAFGCSFLIMVTFFSRSRKLNICIYLIVTTLMFLSIDWAHLLSLFIESLSLPRGLYPQSPMRAYGWFGGELMAPGWHMQLRAGLLYSGIFAIIASVGYVVLKPSRASLFLASNACLSFFVCCSPYMYQWLSDVLGYHSVWRIATLIFTPVIIALVLLDLLDFVFRRFESAQ